MIHHAANHRGASWLVSRSTPALLVGLLAIAITGGCFTRMGGAIGSWTSPTPGAPEEGVVIDARMAFGRPSHGLGGHLAIKNTDDFFQGSLIVEGYLTLWRPTAHPGRLVPYVAGGAHLLQLETYRDAFALGAFSPRGEIGLMALTSPTANPSGAWTISVVAEQHVRFGEGDNRYLLLMLGFDVFATR